MNNEPAGNEQTDSEQDGQNGQPVAFAPPQREEEAHGEHDTGNFGSNNVESAKGEEGADERRAKVAGREGDGTDAALHAGDAAFVGV